VRTLQARNRIQDRCVARKVVERFLSGEPPIGVGRLDAAGTVGGAAKPDPAILVRALVIAGVEPAHAWHVGDDLEADVGAAWAAGVQPVLIELDREMEEASYSLGASERTTFRRIVLPNLRPAILAGAGLAFARAIGERLHTTCETETAAVEHHLRDPGLLRALRQ